MDNIDRWKEQLSKGEITQDEYESLIKSKESLNEMDDLLKKNEE